MCQGYDKLSLYGVRIHGAIDVGSHCIVYMVVSLDKRASTIYKAFSAATSLFGRPRRVRSDFAAEHELVALDMERHWPDADRPPFIAGVSSHNVVRLRFG